MSHHDPRLAAVMAYLCRNYPHKVELSNARLTKLVYLADWESARLFDRQMTGTAWVFNHYGPWVRDVLSLARSDENFRVHAETNAYGTEKTRIELARQDAYVDVLSAEDRRVLDRVIEQTQNMYFGQFIDYVYGTYPVASQERYSELNLVELAKRANAIQPPEPLRGPDRTSVRVTSEDRSGIRMAVHAAVARLLGTAIHEEDLEFLPGEFEQPTIEEVESQYELDIAIGDGGSYTVRTAVSMVVEGFVFRSDVEYLEDTIPTFSVRDYDWNDHYAWAQVEANALVTLRVEREGEAFTADVLEYVLNVDRGEKN